MTHPVATILGLTYILFTTLAVPALMWAGAIFLITLAKRMLK